MSDWSAWSRPQHACTFMIHISPQFQISLSAALGIYLCGINRITVYHKGLYIVHFIYC
jgi:hypothetical protein